MSKIKFIKDPIHNEIVFEKESLWMYELIETLEFKRLLNVYQLGECFNVFVSGTHTRYAHSLGVYHIAKTLLDKIKDINSYDKQVILCAGLLHDIGHGPRSHAFEVNLNFNHEKMTTKIITDENTAINKILKKHKINPIDVANIINKKAKTKWHNSIISSQIDADRLDYLIRDSYHLGVSYGKIDYSILLNWTNIIGNKVVYSYKTINLIETILFARSQMFNQVYLNNSVLTYDILVKKIFTRMKDLYEQKFQFKDIYNLYQYYENFLNSEEWSIKNFLMLDESTFNLTIKSLNTENDKILLALTNSYLSNNEFVVKTVDSQTNCILNDKYFSDFNNFNVYLYDKKQEINIITQDNQIVPFSEVSNFIKAISEKKLAGFVNKNVYFTKKQ